LQNAVLVIRLQNRFMLKFTRSQLQPYGVAVFAVAIASLFTQLFQQLLIPTIFILFFPAVVVSALYGGMSPGILAIILSTLACKYFFLVPRYSLAIADFGTGVRLVVFVFVTLLITTISSELRTARRRAEVNLLKLRSSEERYRVLAENVPQLVWIGGADGFVEYFNQGWLNYTGLQLEETLGWNWQRVVHPDDLPSTLEQWTTGLSAEKPVEVQYRLRRSDGVYRWHIARAVPLHNPNGKIVNWFGTCTDIHDQKQAEQERIQLIQELESKQRLLEAVLQQMPAGLLVAEAPSGRLVLMNEQVQQILQGSLSLIEEVNDYTHYPVFYPDGRRYSPEATPLARSLLTGEVVTAEEIDVLCGDGTRKTLLTDASPIRNAGGEIVAGLLTFYDITDRKRIGERIQLYADVVKNAQVGIVVWQLEDLEDPSSFRLITSNPAARQVTGVDFESLLGTTMAESFPTLMQTQLISDYVEVVRTGQAKDLGEVCYGDEKIADGMFSLKAFPLPNHCLGLAFENITERKQVEEALQDALQKLNFHVENTPLAVIERDCDFRLTRWSQGAERIFGWQTEEVIGKGLHELEFVFDEDKEAVKNIRTRLLSGKEKHNISRNRSYKKDGSLIYCEWYNSALLDESGNLVSVLSLVLDITERKQAEVERINLLEREQAARAEAEAANRIKDEFLAILSHELRSPLNPILGWSKLLQSRKFDEATTVRALETIERNAKLQIQLIEDLLDVSKILRGKLSLTIGSVDLVSTVEAALDTVRLAASAKSIPIKTVYEPDVGQVLGDAARLQQVVWNLLSNAIKFTPNGGQVEVKVSTIKGTGEEDKGHYPETLPVSLHLPGSVSSSSPSPRYAQIQVSDTGKGINPDFLPYVFDYFRQENSSTTRLFGGLGLGLAIVRRLVELHGGRIGAESPGEGQGATFTVWLPMVAIQPETNPENQDSDSCLDLSGIGVLVVDDEADTREFLAFVLEEYGANVTVVASAGEALEALPQVKPDVLLSDIGMPEVDGYMLIRQIRAMPLEEGGQIPALALTAYAGEIDQNQALAAGFTQHVAKPVAPTELAKVIASLIHLDTNPNRY
jgi:PAS domain S-box-containing protein